MICSQTTSAQLISNSFLPGGRAMGRIIPSVVAFGLGAYAFKMVDDREMFTKRNMKKMRKRMMKAIH